MRKLSLFLIFTLSFFVSPAFADGYFRLGGMYLMHSAGPEGATSKSTRTLIDFGAGYVSQKGWSLGALYALEKYDPNDSANRTVMDPTVGWVSRKSSGPYILGTYFLSVERDDNYTGSGYQVDLGYKFALRKISFAPQLSYKKVTYDEQNGAPLSPKEIDDRIDPYFSIWIEF